MLSRLRRWKLPVPLWIGLGIIAGLLVVVAFGPQLAPYDPLALDLAHRLEGPSGAHLLGTDYLGRDTLSRLLVGTRVSIWGAVLAVTVGMALGVLPGMASVFAGSVGSFVLQRIIDALMTLPGIIFAVAVTAVFGNTLTVVMIAIGILYTPRFFRITRAATLVLARVEYVEVAELFGATRIGILRSHIWAKVLPTVLVTAAQTMAAALLAVAGLTFLGLGIAPPHPTWGGMLAADLALILQRPWDPFIPAAAIVLSVLALSLVADHIQTLLNVRVSAFESGNNDEAVIAPAPVEAGSGSGAR
jgi:peptide/nickel transport system permease protein